MNRKKHRFRLLLVVMLISSLFTLQTFAMEINPFGADVGNAIELYVFSCASGSSSSINTSGHSWLLIRNVTNRTITVGVKNVSAGGVVTFGTWGNLSKHVGIWYNEEAYLYSRASSCISGRVSLNMNISSSQLNQINTIISNYDKWSLTNNCSAFAERVWNAVSSTTIDAGTICTPSNLVNSIKSKTGYKTNAAMPTVPTSGTNTSVGYASNGSFVAPTFSYLIPS